jgi:hypothetical protein
MEPVSGDWLSVSVRLWPDRTLPGAASAVQLLLPTDHAAAGALQRRGGVAEGGARPAGDEARAVGRRAQVGAHVPAARRRAGALRLGQHLGRARVVDVDRDGFQHQVMALQVGPEEQRDRVEGVGVQAGRDELGADGVDQVGAHARNGRSLGGDDGRGQVLRAGLAGEPGQVGRQLVRQARDVDGDEAALADGLGAERVVPFLAVRRDQLEDEGGREAGDVDAVVALRIRDRTAALAGGVHQGDRGAHDGLAITGSAIGAGRVAVGPPTAAGGEGPKRVFAGDAAAGAVRDGRAGDGRRHVVAAAASAAAGAEHCGGQAEQDGQQGARNA